MALAAAMALIVILDAVLHWLHGQAACKHGVLGTRGSCSVGLYSSYIPAL